MKRLLCLISNMNAGGAETFLMKLYRAIDREKYQMDFCVNVFEKNYYEDEICSLGGRFFRIPSRATNFREHNNQLSNILKKNKYEYVMAVSSSSTCFYDMKLAKDEGAKRTIVRSSNSANDTSLKGRITHYFFQQMYQKYVDVLVAPSQLAASYLFGSKKHYVPLHNAINYDLFSYNEQKRFLVRKNFGCDENVVVVGHVGRFNMQKNHSRVVDIFKDFNKSHPNSILILVGIGDMQELIKERVREYGLTDKIFFLGLQQDVASYLSAMDVFLFPSFYEGMPNVVIEAQACGLPCVISDTITNEANITGLVKYVSLSASNAEWIKYIEDSLINRHFDTRECFKKNGYFIEDVAKIFVDTVFE